MAVPTQRDRLTGMRKEFIDRPKHVAAGFLLADLSLAQTMLDRAQASCDAYAAVRTRENARRACARVARLLEGSSLDKLRRLEVEAALSELTRRLSAQDRSRRTSAITRTGPPVPPAIFIGNATTTNPFS